MSFQTIEDVIRHYRKVDKGMSKVTEELNFLWKQRLKDYANEKFESNDYAALEVISAVMAIQGLTVKGVEN